MIRATKIKHYLKLMQAKGFEAKQVLADTRIDLNKLQDTDYLIDVWQAQKAIANMLSLSGDDALAFTLTENLSLPDMGILGYALMSCDDVRDSTRLWLTYSHFLNGQMTHVSIEEDDSQWHVVVSELMPQGPLLSFSIEESLMYGKFIGESLMNQPYVFSNLSVSYPRPKHYKVYEAVFNCPIQYNAKVNRLTVASPSLSQPSQPPDKELHDICIQHCQRVLEKITSQQPLATRIRDVLLKNQGLIPSLDDAAKSLHMSSRSLRRHLQNEGLSFQQLVNGYRCDLAKEYLQSTDFSIQEVGFLLGYKDTKAFLRAFKTWTGYTVNTFRVAAKVNKTQ